MNSLFRPQVSPVCSVRSVACWMVGLLLLMPLQLSAFEPAPPPTAAEQKRLELYLQPNSYFEGQLKNPPEVVDGHRLHPKIQHYQEQRGRQPEARQAMDDWWAQFLVPEQRYEARRAVDRTWTYRSKITEPMAKVEDLKVPGPAGDIDVRIYTPKSDSKGLLPVLVYIHGGGWIMGSIVAADRAVKLLANEADVIVVSTNYRMAPEHKFPAAQEDTQAVFQWAVEHARGFGGDPSRVGVGGDSAGGQMALVTSLRQWEDGEVVPAWQLLYYPVTDLRYNYSSYDKFGDGFGLNQHFLEKMVEFFTSSEADLDHPHASPMRASSLAGMPPTIIVTANYDPLRDQGRGMADRLRDEGVPVIYRNYGSLTHGFMQHSMTIDDAEMACNESARLFGTAIRDRYMGPYYQ